MTSFKQNDLLATGWIPGNPRYFSPEHVSGEQAFVDPMSDIFSLGVILYELVTGRGPYRSEGGMRLVEEILNPTVEPLSNIEAGIPPGFDRICARAMARSPKNRYQSMEDLAHELQAIIVESTDGQSRMFERLPR